MSDCNHTKWRTFNGGKCCRCARCDLDPSEELTRLKSEVERLRGRCEEAETENERVRQANLDVMMHFDDMKAAKGNAELKLEKLELENAALKSLADNMDAAIEADANAVNSLQEREASKLLFRAHEAYLIYKEGDLGKAIDSVILRKQAEAVEALASARFVYGTKERLAAMDYAQRLRQQAAESEK